MTSPNTSEERRSAVSNKRRRTAQACGPCRNKKTKCDGVHPSCTPCKDLGYTCSYPLESSAPRPGAVTVDASYLQALEARLAKLESSGTPPATHATPEHNTVGVPSHSHNSMSVPVRHIADEHVDFGQDYDLSRLLGSPGGGWPITPQVERAPIRSNIDGMGLLLAPDRQSPIGALDWLNPVSQVAYATSPTGEVYGETSGITFHSLLLNTLLPGYDCLNMMEYPTGVPTSLPRHRNENTGFLDLPIPRGDAFQLQPEDLPSTLEAQAMWDFYSLNTYQLYPFIDLLWIRQSYERLFINVVDGRSRQSSVAFLAELTNQPILTLCFVIFALVSGLSAPTLTNKPVLHTAMRLLRNHLDWPHSTLKVQALVMGTMLLQSLDCPSHSWDLLGYAVRCAYAIGLHDPATSAKLPPGGREMRHRIWWACFTLDHLLTVSTGRPAAITVDTNTMPLPSAVAGEPEMPVRFFAASIRLYRSLSRLVRDPPSLPSERSSTISSIQAAASASQELENEYALWLDSLDSDLRWTGLASSANAAVLALRGMTMRLLLHRPLVLAAIRQNLGIQSRASSPDGRRGIPAQRSLELQQRHIAFGTSLGAIIETAVGSVNILERSLSASVILSAPWYQLFYAMNAFMTLVATFVLDLSRWTTFIKIPVNDIKSSLFTLFVQKIEVKYKRHNARQASTIIRQLLQVLGLQAPTATSGDLQLVPAVMNPLNTMNPFESLPFEDSSAGLQSLPHLDFEDLCKTLDLSGLMEQYVQPTVPF